MFAAAMDAASCLLPLQVLRLWEALWAGEPGLHLYMCLAVLEHHRRRILR
jgi:hypothetical protein